MTEKEKDSSIVLISDDKEIESLTEWLHTHFGTAGSRWTVGVHEYEDLKLAVLEIHNRSDRLVFDLVWRDCLTAIGWWRDP